MSDAEARMLPVQIDSTTLDVAGMSTWMTDAGPFDVLAGLKAADGHLVLYEELVERATSLHGDGFVVRAAGLDDIIAAKERADRPKDREALPELRSIREALTGGNGPRAAKPAPKGVTGPGVAPVVNLPRSQRELKR